jgi:DNA primase
MLPSEEIKDKINIVDLISEYVPLRKAGVNFRALCPFHQEKTPSFIVSPSKQIWHCFGCQIGGDIFEFIKQSEGVEFPEALQILASRAGVTVVRPTIEYRKEQDQKDTLLAINDLAARFYAKILAESRVAVQAREYLAKRGLKPETIQKWQLGYAPSDFHVFENFIIKKGYQKREAVAAGLLVEKDQAVSVGQSGDFFDRFRDRIMFPLFDIHGRVVGFTGRILEGATAAGSVPQAAGKYVNSPETLIYSKSNLLYGLHLAKTEIRKTDQVIIVEGNMDVITCHEAGFSNVVGSSGTALTERQLAILERFTNNLAFSFDVDEAGLLATRRAVELALAKGFNVKIISLPKSLAKDPDELIRREPALWAEQVKNAKNFLDFYFEAIFANLNLDDSLAKKQAVGDFLPLLALVPDPIDRMHYVQRLSRKISVDERILLELLNKRLSAAKGPSMKLSRPAPRRLEKQEILERRILGLLLKFPEKLQKDWEDLEVEDFTTQVLCQIIQSIKPLVLAGKYLESERENLKPSLVQEIDLLVFAVENELSLKPDWSLEDVRTQFLTEYRITATKHKMEELVNKIRFAENQGRLEEIKNLSLEFNNLSQELSKYAT